MKKSYPLVSLLLTCAFFLCSPALYSAELSTAVQRVIDGDTFVTTDGDTVRLLGINTPETGSGKRTAEPFGNKASTFARHLLLHKDIKLVTQRHDRDRYGRLLADAYLQDGTWVNGLLLKEGMAHIYTFPDSTYNSAALFAAEEAARLTHKGLWTLPRWQIIPARDCCSRTQLGMFHLVEGVVRNVVTVKGRTYLNFGDDWRTDFTAEVREPDWDKFDDLKAFEGQRVRVRGYIKPINGALVTVTHPEQMERVTDSRLLAD